MTEQPLTYEYLASIAVIGPHDDTTGAYRNSPLSPDIGLHIHTADDGWVEEEPECPVHFVMYGSKMAAVYPDHLQIQDRYISDTMQPWLDRLKRDNPDTRNG